MSVYGGFPRGAVCFVRVPTTVVQKIDDEIVKKKKTKTHYHKIGRVYRSEYVTMTVVSAQNALAKAAAKLEKHINLLKYTIFCISVVIWVSAPSFFRYSTNRNFVCTDF